MTGADNRSGFALLMALFAVLVMAALVTATALWTAQDARIARAETLSQRAFTGGETALWETLLASDARTLRAAPVGAVTAVHGSDGELTTNVTVTKVDTAMVWMFAEAWVRRGSEKASHRLGLSAIIPADTADHRLQPVPDRGWVDLF